MEGGEEGRGTQIVKNYLMKFSSARFSDCSKMAQKIAMESSSFHGGNRLREIAAIFRSRKFHSKLIWHYVKEL